MDFAAREVFHRLTDERADLEETDLIPEETADRLLIGTVDDRRSQPALGDRIQCGTQAVKCLKIRFLKGQCPVVRQ